MPNKKGRDTADQKLFVLLIHTPFFGKHLTCHANFYDHSQVTKIHLTNSTYSEGPTLGSLFPLPPQIPSYFFLSRILSSNVHKYVKTTSQIALPEISVCSGLKSTDLERCQWPNFFFLCFYPTTLSPGTVPHSSQEAKVCCVSKKTISSGI